MTSAASVKNGTTRCPPGRPRGDANEIPAPGALKRVSALVDGPRARFKGSRCRMLGGPAREKGSRHRWTGPGLDSKGLGAECSGPRRAKWGLGIGGRAPGAGPAGTKNCSQYSPCTWRLRAGFLVLDSAALHHVLFRALAHGRLDPKPLACADPNPHPSFMSGPTFEAVVAPLGTAARNYLEARGLTTLHLLVHAAADESAFTEAIVAPFIAGFQVGDVEHKHDSDGVLITALLTIAWTDARASVAPPAQPAPPAALHAPALPAAGPVKIPTTLAMCEWRSYVDRFGERWGGKRRFPVDVLLGAESVLARLPARAPRLKDVHPAGSGRDPGREGLYTRTPPASSRPRLLGLRSRAAPRSGPRDRVRPSDGVGLLGWLGGR